MTTEKFYYFCTICQHVHLANSQLGKLHIEHSYKTQKQKKEMSESDKGIQNLGDVQLKKKNFIPGAKKTKKLMRRKRG